MSVCIYINIYIYMYIGEVELDPRAQQPATTSRVHARIARGQTNRSTSGITSPLQGAEVQNPLFSPLKRGRDPESQTMCWPPGYPGELTHSIGLRTGTPRWLIFVYQSILGNIWLRAGVVCASSALAETELTEGTSVPSGSKAFEALRLWAADVPPTSLGLNLIYYTHMQLCPGMVW